MGRGVAARDDDPGFTLVEIVVAIVLVAVLGATVVIGVGRIVDDGAASACTASLDAARSAATGHWATAAARADSFDELVASGALEPPDGATVAPETISTPDWVLHLVPAGAGAAPRFVCTRSGPVGAGDPLADGWVGVDYAAAPPSISGVAAPLAFEPLTVPAGVTMAADGALSGRPTEPGDTVVRALVTDAGGSTVVVARTLRILPDTTRYWVGASAAWADPSNWSRTSGGPGGAGVPGPTTDVVLDAADTTDLTVNGAADVAVRSWTQAAGYTGTVTVATTYGGAFRTLSVVDDVTIAGGTWTHPANGTTQTSRLDVTIGGDLTIAAGGRIDVAGRGFSEGAGPGASTVAYQGASHGGRGVGSGLDGLGASPPAYGSYDAPVDLGSGGGPIRTGTSRGGGAVRLVVAGASTIDGTVSAAGACATEYAGCAAGGSVWLTTGTLAGTGALRAGGGATTWTAPSGGGGRVAVHLTSGQTVGGVALDARGGPSVPRASIGFAAGAGTVYVQRPGDAPGRGELVVDNGTQPSSTPTVTPIPAGATWRPGRLVLRNGGVLAVEPGSTLDLTATDIAGSGGSERPGIRAAGGSLLLPTAFDIRGWWLAADSEVVATGTWTIGTGGGITHTPMTSATVRRAHLRLTGDLTIQPGGLIDVTGRGYPARTGPGAQYGTNGQIVGSHGGLASPNGQTYGDPVTPVEPGSGSHGSAGGGVIALDVTGTLRVDGAVRADATSCGWNCGGGSAGGSVRITAATVTGTGSISANGGTDGWHGGGAGGRVSVTQTASATNPAAPLTIRTLGGWGPGSGASGTVGAGTVFLRTTAGDSLVVGSP